jgi:hypothetical protein
LPRSPGNHGSPGGTPGSQGGEWHITPAHPTHRCERVSSRGRTGDGLSQGVASPRRDTRHGDAQGLTSGGGHLDGGGFSHPRHRESPAVYPEATDLLIPSGSPNRKSALPQLAGPGVAINAPETAIVPSESPPRQAPKKALGFLEASSSTPQFHPGRKSGNSRLPDAGRNRNH